MEKGIVIKVEGGVNAKVANNVAKALHTNDCTVYLQKGSKRANAKSIMGVISLTLKQGDAVVIVAVGIEEEAAVNSVAKILG